MSQKFDINMAWKRPVSRLYHYNLDVGENYYSPMTTYLDEKYSGLRTAETPGALSFRLNYMPILRLLHSQLQY
jgi:hypothetical protein